VLDVAGVKLQGAAAADGPTVQGQLAELAEANTFLQAQLLQAEKDRRQEVGLVNEAMQFIECRLDEQPPTASPPPEQASAQLKLDAAVAEQLEALRLGQRTLQDEVAALRRTSGAGPHQLSAQLQDIRAQLEDRAAAHARGEVATQAVEALAGPFRVVQYSLERFRLGLNCSKLPSGAMHHRLREADAQADAYQAEMAGVIDAIRADITQINSLVGGGPPPSEADVDAAMVEHRQVRKTPSWPRIRADVSLL
jgi:hypothetical protein